jgi:hypothetical protein
MTGKVAQLRVLHERLEHLEAVHLRHFHVEQHHVELFAAQHLEGHAPFSAHRRAVALLLEPARHEQAVHLVVVDDEEARLAARGGLRVHRHIAFSAAATRSYSRARGRARRACRGRPACRKARGPSPAAASAVAPKVLAFDLSECAARRNLSGVALGEPGAHAVEHDRRLLQEGVHQLDHEVRARGVLQRLEGVRSIVMSVVLGLSTRSRAPRRAFPRGSAW